jgi:hypothetical protein
MSEFFKPGGTKVSWSREKCDFWQAEGRNQTHRTRTTRSAPSEKERASESTSVIPNNLVALVYTLLAAKWEPKLCLNDFLLWSHFRFAHPFAFDAPARTPSHHSRAQRAINWPCNFSICARFRERDAFSTPINYKRAAFLWDFDSPKLGWNSLALNGN